jgi:phosphate transport system permease protein
MTAITNDLPRDRALAEPRDLDLRGKSGSRAIKNSVATAVMWAAFAIAVIPLVWILVTVAVKGGHLILDSTWWTNSQQGVTARREGGGAVHAIQGTLIQGLVTALISVPIGVLTAVYLVEYGRGRFARIVSFMVDILTGVPSIVAGLFIYAVFITTFGFTRAGIFVCLSLTLLMIPVVVRSTEEMLKLVPNELREAAYALGVPKWKTMTKVVLPTAFSGIITGVLLGLARVMGETAPLLILGPYTKAIASISSAAISGDASDDDQPGPRPGLTSRHRPDLGRRAHAHPIVLLLNLLGRLASRFSKV